MSLYPSLKVMFMFVKGIIFLPESDDAHDHVTLLKYSYFFMQFILMISSPSQLIHPKSSDSCHSTPSLKPSDLVSVLVPGVINTALSRFGICVLDGYKSLLSTCMYTLPSQMGCTVING